MNSKPNTDYDRRLRSDEIPNQAGSNPPSAPWRGRIPRGMMLRGGLVALIFLPLVTGGCLAGGLGHPGERVWIPCHQITEEQLKAKGLRYEKYVLTKEQLQQAGFRCTGETVEWYVVEKSDLQEFGDHVFNAALAPVAVAAEVTILFALLALSCYSPY